jgi:hypothetical protein
VSWRPIPRRERRRKAFADAKAALKRTGQSRRNLGRMVTNLMRVMPKREEA